MDCSMPGLPVPHHLLEFAQVHVHCINDAIQPSHPLMPSSLSALNFFQHLGFFPNESAACIRWPKCWRFSFSISPSSKYLGLISLKINLFYLLVSKGLQESSPAPQFKGINSLALCLLYGPALTNLHDQWGDHSLDCMDFCQQSNVFAFQQTVYVCHSFPAKKQLSSNFIRN